MSTGDVQFCCFSDGIIGNVNQQPFDKIWNGPTMQRIRRSLIEQRLPPQCQSTSCPIYRGDRLHYIISRMEGHHSFERTGTHDHHASIRARLQNSEVQVVGRNSDRIGLNIEFKCEGQQPVIADLFIAIRVPNGTCYFLPDAVEYPTPFRCAIELNAAKTPLRLTATSPPEYLKLSGDYEFCVALFEKESNPNLISNCYWSVVSRLAVS
jgi:hypothetical protein